ncbi:hypothetical protein OG884_18480 [Streptosporangium sp. NBC_01755]|uniref:hypothetical protein n=1 Tax=Streptosporangium sp. NBC_01755 TaxID=2975949 RepID=UPI002DDBB896|nr:hypothetical protein [Streptosporangium sp. NBC_01755]WSD03794.1 hypothetical protein OG884_18480 [Streptosporangium sp. NBC_01755]
MCLPYHHLLDHGRIWLDQEGRYVLTGEPYEIDGHNLGRFTKDMAALGLQISVKPKSESFWYPGHTFLILITRKSLAARESPPSADSGHVSWEAIEETVRQRWGGSLRYRNSRERFYGIPSPAGGHMTLEVTLRPRWCSLAVDRWRTTDRHEEPSQAWFEEHAWPVVQKAYKEKRTGYGALPGGGGSFSSASPIDRSDLLDLLIAWVDAELVWGKPADSAKNVGGATR